MQGKNLLFLVIWTFFILVPGPVLGESPGQQIAIEYSFNESHVRIYEQMLAQNASVGEYYERVCPEFLEGMSPETRAHAYNTTMARHEPPGKQAAIGVASPVISVCGVPTHLAGIGTLALVGIVILGLLAAIWLIRKKR
ncbi:hypothetical protein [Methanoculleus sp.]|nr:hypothetical protein [Methanoculleus sp.]